MDVGLIWFKADGNLQAIDTAFDVALLQQGFAELVLSIGGVRSFLNDFPHQLQAALGLLLGQQNKGEMIFCFKIFWVQRKFILELACCLGQPAGFKIDQPAVEMSQTNFAVERDGGAQFRERFVDVASLIMSLTQKYVQLRSFVTD